jgi:TPR repeat protein
MFTSEQNAMEQPDPPVLLLQSPPVTFSHLKSQAVRASPANRIQALLTVVECFHTGSLTRKNPQLAVEWMAVCAEAWRQVEMNWEWAGSTASRVAVAQDFLTGQGRYPGNLVFGLEWLVPLAAEGNAWAQREHGLLLLDVPTRVQEWRHAMKDPSGPTVLPVESMPALAVSCLWRAALQSDIPACVHLAQHCYAGHLQDASTDPTGLPEKGSSFLVAPECTRAEAAQMLLLRAALQWRQYGNGAAAVPWGAEATGSLAWRTGIATALLNGTTLPRHDGYAREWLSAAAAEGFAPAQTQLGMLLHVDYLAGSADAHLRAIRLLTSAARQGNAAAQLHLASLLYTTTNGLHPHIGDLVEQATSTCRQVTRRDPGFPLALLDLCVPRDIAFMCRKGVGLPKNPTVAYAWLQHAATFGDASDLLRLGLVLRSTTERDELWAQIERDGVTRSSSVPRAGGVQQARPEFEVECAGIAKRALLQACARGSLPACFVLFLWYVKCDGAISTAIMDKVVTLATCLWRQPDMDWEGVLSPVERFKLGSLLLPRYRDAGVEVLTSAAVAGYARAARLLALLDGGLGP